MKKQYTIKCSFEDGSNFEYTAKEKTFSGAVTKMIKLVAGMGTVDTMSITKRKIKA